MKFVCIGHSTYDITLPVEKYPEENIKYQFEVLENGGTDAGAIHLSCGGVPTGCISIPTRYIHTPCEMADKNDINCAVKLLTKMIEKGFKLK